LVIHGLNWFPLQKKSGDFLTPVLPFTKIESQNNRVSLCLFYRHARHLRFCVYLPFLSPYFTILIFRSTLFTLYTGCLIFTVLNFLNIFFSFRLFHFHNLNMFKCVQCPSVFARKDCLLRHGKTKIIQW